MSRHPFSASATPPSPETPETEPSNALSTPLGQSSSQLEDPRNLSTPLSQLFPNDVAGATSQLENTHLTPPSSIPLEPTPYHTPFTRHESSPEDRAESSAGRAKVDAAEIDRAYDEDIQEVREDEAVHFVLLAEFDIDLGSTISQQYPYPTGTDEQ